MNNITQKPRNHGVTIAKAIAIILMVMGHSGCPGVVDHFFAMVRMPVFFMMSGLCFKEEYIENGKKYLSKRVSGIYIPYIKWGLIFLLFHNLFCYVGLYDIEYGHTTDKDAPYTIVQMAIKAVQMLVLMVGNDKLLGGFWFLHDLFFGSLLFYVTIKTTKKSYLAPILLIACALVSNYILEGMNLGEKSMVISRTFFASSFIAMGYAFKTSELHFETSWLYIIGINVIVFVISLFWFSRFQDCTWRNMILYALLAIPGALSIYGIGQHISLKTGRIRDMLVYIGGKTFNVLTWHMLSMKLVSLVIILTYGLVWERLAEFPYIGEYAGKGWNIVYLVVGVGVPVMGSCLIDKVKDRWSAKS